MKKPALHSSSPGILDLARTSAVFDNGRRGEPRMGCDCVRCFGYCMIDRDIAFRESIQAAQQMMSRTDFLTQLGDHFADA